MMENDNATKQRNADGTPLAEEYPLGPALAKLRVRSSLQHTERQARKAAQEAAEKRFFEAVAALFTAQGLAPRRTKWNEASPRDALQIEQEGGTEPYIFLHKVGGFGFVKGHVGHWAEIGEVGVRYDWSEDKFVSKKPGDANALVAVVRAYEAMEARTLEQG